MTAPEIPPVHHRYLDVDDARVFYREAGPEDAPTLLLLHGFPSGSHQYRRLIDALGGHYHLVAPDYPGFGHTEVADDFVYSFESLAAVTEAFVQKLGLDRFFLYMFDFGGPVGLRLATRRPERIAGLVVQNANAYEVGLSEVARAVIANRPGVDGAVERVKEILVPEATRAQYEDGAFDVASVAPDGWTLDQHFLDRPGRQAAQVALALDYHTNVDLYPRWQQWLREHRPPTLVLWGRNDPIFLDAGARAYLQDLPDAELHLFDTGHFALEESLPEIAPIIATFLDRHARGSGSAPRPAADAVGPPTGRGLKLAVIGATGSLGSAVAHEAAARGHQVTTLSSAGVDGADPASVERAVAGHDAVVAAVKGPEQLVPRCAGALLEALPRAGVDRLVFVGGGGSLERAPGLRFVDAPDFPPQYLETARDQAEALSVLRSSDSPVHWSYASPPPVHLVPGRRTGRYRAEARDTPLVDEQGESRVTVGAFAAAIVDAVENGSFVQERFTVAS